MNEVLVKIVKSGKKLSELSNEELAELYESHKNNSLSVDIWFDLNKEIQKRLKD